MLQASMSLNQTSNSTTANLLITCSCMNYLLPIQIHKQIILPQNKAQQLFFTASISPAIRYIQLQQQK